MNEQIAEWRNPIIIKSATVEQLSSCREKAASSLSVPLTIKQRAYFPLLANETQWRLGEKMCRDN